MRTSTGKSTLEITCKNQYIEDGELACMETGQLCGNCPNPGRKPTVKEVVATSPIGFVGKEQAQAELHIRNGAPCRPEWVGSCEGCPQEAGHVKSGHFD